MTLKKKRLSAHAVWAVIALSTAAVGYWFAERAEMPSSSEAKPIYWVAPMDPNYRRDGPGKSPMGMDLVPVYAEDASQPSPGVVSIDSSVVQNIGVQTAPVERRALAHKIETVGSVLFDEDRLIHIHPRVEGWVDTLFVKTSGAPVVQGQPLYTLYSPNLVNAQEELLLALRSDNPRLLASAEERLRSLNITQRFIDQLKRERKAQQNVTFYAPQGGVVDNLKIREGYFVQPGTTMMSIGVLEQVWVEAEVLETNVADVKQGQPVHLTVDALPGRQWHGEVDYVYPALNPQQRTLRVRLKFANPDSSLKPGMFAAVTIDSGSEAERLVAPHEAVIRFADEARVVLALGEGRFKSVAVTLGARDREGFEILSGIKEGDEVVTAAQFLLDSESSKTSDFKRLTAVDDLPSATVAGRINALELAAGTVNISRAAIPKWQRGPATLDFKIAPGLPADTWQPGSEVHFTFVIDDGEFIITDLHLMPTSDAEPATSHGDHGVHHD